MLHEVLNIIIVESLSNLCDIDGCTTRIDIRHFVDFNIPAWRFNPLIGKVYLNALTLLVAGLNFDQLAECDACTLTSNAEYANESIAHFVPTSPWCYE